MGRFRQYKCGIYGLRYDGEYIAADKTGPRKYTYQVVKKDGTALSRTYDTLEDAEWYVDKSHASEEDLICIHELYGRDIYELTSMMVAYMDKPDDTLTAEQKLQKKWAEKVRNRKAANLPE